jgi:ribonuclease D
MLITDAAACADAIAQLSASPWLTVDTEFVREETYWPQLCLVQVGDAKCQMTFDALALGDLTPLFDLLKRPGIPKVFHAASQDLEIFVHRDGVAPEPVFDTQIAAGLLGIGDQLGYAGLVDKRLGVKLDKSLSRTDWARRPLSAAELAYAEDDVRHLGAFYPELRDELIAAGRLAWLEEDCTRLARRERYLPRPERAWERLKGLARLPAQAQHVAAALASWRETTAEARNRPRKWILADDALYRLAERQPTSMDQLSALQALPPKLLERQGKTLLDVIAAVRQSRAAALAVEWVPDSAQKALFQQLAAHNRETAAALNIPASMLATRADLEALVTKGAAACTPLLEGWRREVAGAELLRLAAAG